MQFIAINNVTDEINVDTSLLSRPLFWTLLMSAAQRIWLLLLIKLIKFYKQQIDFISRLIDEY